MGQFNFEKKNTPDQTIVLLGGQIDEDANFSTIDISASQQLCLDLEKVGTINSCGIREWIKWIKTAPSGCKIIYKNCPKVIVDQINMVSGFLPEGAEVESFFVPYFCDDTGNEKMVLFRKGQEFKNGEVFPPEAVTDTGGQAMEMDVIEAKYFKFLKK